MSQKTPTYEEIMEGGDETPSTPSPTPTPSPKPQPKPKTYEEMMEGEEQEEEPEPIEHVPTYEEQMSGKPYYQTPKRKTKPTRTTDPYGFMMSEDIPKKEEPKRDITPLSDSYNFMMSEGSYEIVSQRPSHKWYKRFDTSQAPRHEFPKKQPAQAKPFRFPQREVFVDPTNPFAPMFMFGGGSVAVSELAKKRPDLFPDITPEQMIYPYVPAKQVFGYVGGWLGRKERDIVKWIDEHYPEEIAKQTVKPLLFGTPPVQEEPTITWTGEKVERRYPSEDYVPGKVFAQTLAVTPVATAGFYISTAKYGLAGIGEATTKKGVTRAIPTLPISLLMPMAPPVALASGKVKLPVETVGAIALGGAMAYEGYKSLEPEERGEFGLGLAIALGIGYAGAKAIPRVGRAIKTSKAKFSPEYGIYTEKVSLPTGEGLTSDIVAMRKTYPKMGVLTEETPLPETSFSYTRKVGGRAVTTKDVSPYPDTSVPIDLTGKTKSVDVLLQRDPETGFMKFVGTEDKVTIPKDIKILTYQPARTPQTVYAPKKTLRVIKIPGGRAVIDEGGIISPLPKDIDPFIIPKTETTLSWGVRKAPGVLHEDTIVFDVKGKARPTVRLEKTGQTLLRKGVYSATGEMGISEMYPSLVPYVKDTAKGFKVKGGKYYIIQEGKVIDPFADFTKTPKVFEFPEDISKGTPKAEIVPKTYSKYYTRLLRELEELESGVGVSSPLGFGISKQPVSWTPIMDLKAMVPDVSMEAPSKKRPKLEGLSKTVGVVDVGVGPTVKGLSGERTATETTPVQAIVSRPEFSSKGKPKIKEAKPTTVEPRPKPKEPIVPVVVVPTKTWGGDSFDEDDRIGVTTTPVPKETPITVHKTTPSLIIDEPGIPRRRPPPEQPPIRLLPASPGISWGKGKKKKKRTGFDWGFGSVKRKDDIFPLADYLSVTVTELKTGKKATHQLPTLEVKKRFEKTRRSSPFTFTFPTVEMLEGKKKKKKKSKSKKVRLI